MKRSFFPILFAAVVLLTASCIKNTESDGVKAVRMGQAAWLTAQATATTTLATANATLLTAQAAVQTALATVNTANAKFIDANSAFRAAETATVVELNRHTNAMQLLEEAVKTATNKTELAAAANALLEENARSAAALSKLADKKIYWDSQVAQDKLKADQDLAKATLRLAEAKLANSVALANAQWNADEDLLLLKAKKLDRLAAEYGNANTAYLNTLAEIQGLQTKIADNKNMQIAYTSSPYLFTVTFDPVLEKVVEVLWDGKTFVAASGRQVTGPVFLADSGNVKIARKNLADGIAKIPTLTSDVSKAQANDDAAKALVTYWQNLKDATATTAKATADDASVKRDAEANVYAQLKLNYELLHQQITNPDIYGTVADNGVNGTWTKAKIAFDAAKLDLKAKEDLALPTTQAYKDSAAAYWAFQTNADLGSLDDRAWGNEGTGVTTEKAWKVIQVGLIAPAIASVPYVNAVSIQNILYPESGWPVGTAGAEALAKATATLNWAQAKYNAALAAMAKIRADITTASATKISAEAAYNTLNDAQIALQKQVDGAKELMLASAARISWYNVLIAYIYDTTTIPPGVAFVNDLAYVNAQLVIATANKATTKTKLADAKTALQDQQDKNAVTLPALIVKAISDYKANVAMNPVAYAYLQIQIDAWTAQIASLNIILGIQKAALTMWTDKVKLALQ